MRDGVDIRACRRPGLLNTCDDRPRSDGIEFLGLRGRHAIAVVSRRFLRCRVRHAPVAVP